MDDCHFHHITKLTKGQSYPGRRWWTQIQPSSLLNTVVAFPCFKSKFQHISKDLTKQNSKKFHIKPFKNWTRESYDHSFVKHPGSHKRHSFSLGGAVWWASGMFLSWLFLLCSIWFSQRYSQNVPIQFPLCSQCVPNFLKCSSNDIVSVTPMYLWSLFVCLFLLSHWDLPNHNTSCCILGIVGNPSMRWGRPYWFHNVSTYVGKVIEYLCHWRLN